jgi:hypothetical protein
MEELPLEDALSIVVMPLEILVEQPMEVLPLGEEPPNVVVPPEILNPLTHGPRANYPRKFKMPYAQKVL